MNSKNLLRLITFVNREPNSKLFCNNINSCIRQLQPRCNYSDNLPPDKWLTKKIYHALHSEITTKLKVFDDMCSNINAKASAQLSNAAKNVYTKDKVMNNKYFIMVFKALCVCRSTIKKCIESDLFKATVLWIQVKLLQLLKLSVDFGNKIYLKYEKGGEMGGHKVKNNINTNSNTNPENQTQPEVKASPKKQ